MIEFEKIDCGITPIPEFKDGCFLMDTVIKTISMQMSQKREEQIVNFIRIEFDLHDKSKDYILKFLSKNDTKIILDGPESMLVVNDKMVCRWNNDMCVDVQHYNGEIKLIVKSCH